MTCKFEPGKEYRTLGGKRAVVYAVYQDQDFSVHGAIFDDDEQCWATCEWHDGGFFVGKDAPTYVDLVPPPREWAVWEKIDTGFITSVDMSTHDKDWRKVKVREILEE